MTTVAKHAPCMEGGNFKGKSWGQAKPIKTDYYSEIVNVLSRLNQLYRVKREDSWTVNRWEEEKSGENQKHFGFQNNTCKKM